MAVDNDRIGGTEPGSERMAMFEDGKGTASVHLYRIKSNSLVTGRFPIEDIVELVNTLPGVTATYTPPTPPTPPLPTEPGIYIGASMGERLEQSQIYKLKDYGWTDANGHHVDTERVERLAKASDGLIRLVPEGHGDD